MVSAAYRIVTRPQTAQICHTCFKPTLHEDGIRAL